MVRLEILYIKTFLPMFKRFTFQYGQIRNAFASNSKYISISIYIPVWLDQKFKISDEAERLKADLHSSMVRLEIYYINRDCLYFKKFTFQYGQIRN